MAEARRPMTHAERGRKGMRSRWGPQRVVRLDKLDPATASVIRAILRAEENADQREAAAVNEMSATAVEVRRGSVEPAA